MNPINEAHVSEPGLVVVDIATADDATALAFQQLLADRRRCGGDGSQPAISGSPPAPHPAAQAAG